MDNSYLSKEDLAYLEEMKRLKEEKIMLSEIADQLKLTTVTTTQNEVLVPMKQLWELLSDEKKCKELLSRVKNKAFW